MSEVQSSGPLKNAEKSQNHVNTCLKISMTLTLHGFVSQLRQGQYITPQGRNQGQDIIPRPRQDQDTAIPSTTKARLAPRCRQDEDTATNNISIQSTN